MLHVLGTCSNCGGDVTMPSAWYAVVPPVPTCTRCGAKAQRNLPEVPMEPPKHKIPKPEDLGLGDIAKLEQTLHGLG